ncbi:hypothetical protein H8N03_19770 [Ramlibacter sp. USB13]|uniref:Uncharacterized protein n=1 Tax=Ramlibacter cellulosilyticus TaxID=2764187 RepID=A0A923MTN8_9BURK|nr:DUF5996 family protein [Ramlibacter cellulosilyticus]MBC5785195.1 hypothetical protein [Ramlibacter cellulosilyticus]
MPSSPAVPASAWPPLPWPAWQATHEAIHLWTQVLGKLQLAGTPWTNHSWHVAFQPTARGLATALVPCEGRTWQATFDFLDHALVLEDSAGGRARVPLRPQSVAQFYEAVRQALHGLGIPCAIRTQPSEIADALPFQHDEAVRPYDADAAQRWWRVLLQAHRVLRIFRARYAGKCSPVHFFWGAADLAVTRFSGRTAPPHPGGAPHLADWVMREAYSHEVSSCGFWAGAGLGEPAFYSYAYPEPEGFAQWPVQPEGAYYSKALREFILPYEVVRKAGDAVAVLLAFLQSTYEAAAVKGRWDRAAVEVVLP